METLFLGIISALLIAILYFVTKKDNSEEQNKDEYLIKKKNLENLNFQNTWINVNQNLLSILNEN